MNFLLLVHFRKLYNVLITLIHTCAHIYAYLIAYGLRKVHNDLQFKRNCTGVLIIPHKLVIQRLSSTVEQLAGKLKAK
jgi:hypothetical protein